MEQRVIRSDDFCRERIAQLEADLRRTELALSYAQDSSRRAWAMASWVRQPSATSPPTTPSSSGQADRPTS